MIETPLKPALCPASKGLALAAFLLAAVATASAQHFHVAAGAPVPSAGSQAYFANADTFVAESGFVFNMVLRTNGVAAGLYDGGPTFTAAASELINGGPQPGHAAPGAQLALVVKSLEGPAGSEWAFWESAGCEDFGETITFRTQSGQIGGTNQFLLSQNSGLPGEDPYGHCHGRRFTTTRPGLHTLGVQVIDVSRNGPNGGPLHPPSQMYRFHFQAGVTISKLIRDANGVQATFGTRNGSRYYLETSPSLTTTSAWITVAGPASGNNRLQALQDSSAANTQAFYRLRVTTP